MTTDVNRSELLAESLFGPTGLSTTATARIADRVLVDPVQAGIVEAYARLIDSLAMAVETQGDDALVAEVNGVQRIVTEQTDSDWRTGATNDELHRALGCAKRWVEVS